MLVEVTAAEPYTIGAELIPAAAGERASERFVICGCGDALALVADRAALVARWTNAARELVDAPPNVTATFLQQFAGEGPWAHVDMLGPGYLDEDRGDAFGRGATGYGVRMLIELAAQLTAATPA